MGKSWKLFTLFGFKVRLHISWLIIAVLLAWSLAQGYFPFVVKGLSAGTYWAMGIVGTIALFLCVVLHEFGHSIVARKYGLPMKGITLFIFGGVAEMEDEPQTPKTEFMMAIAGPAVSVVLGAIFYLFSLWGESLSWPMPVNQVLYYLGWINGVLAAFNLIPAFPLDGGRVLRSFLWSRRGNLRTATRTAAKVGSGFGMVLIGFGVLSILF
jgi:Zn-dependent protease